MSYNADLQANNADLQSILDSINALPEAKADPTLQEKTVTPGVDEQTVTPDAGYDGLSSVVVAGDASLVPENIVSGASIFGVAGTGGGIETVDLVVDLTDVKANTYVAYINSDGLYSSKNCSATATTTLTIAKQSLLYAQRIGNSMGAANILVSGATKFKTLNYYANATTTFVSQAAVIYVSSGTSKVTIK